MLYDTASNITKKNDVCSDANCFVYGGGSAKPHELTSIVGTYNGVTNPSFSYDANGNLQSGADRSFGWMSFNKPYSITDGGTSLGLAYGAEHERYKLCSPSCTSPTSTTLYLYDPATGGMSEKVVSGSATNWRDYIVADGQIVAVRSTPLGQVKWTYVVGDHLGSPTTFTDANKVVTESASYDAWGKRRNADGTDDANCSLSSQITRGYTGHEMLSPCLIRTGPHSGRSPDHARSFRTERSRLAPNLYGGGWFLTRCRYSSANAMVLKSAI